MKIQYSGYIIDGCDNDGWMLYLFGEGTSSVQEAIPYATFEEAEAHVLLLELGNVLDYGTIRK